MMISNIHKRCERVYPITIRGKHPFEGNTTNVTRVELSLNFDAFIVQQHINALALTKRLFKCDVCGLCFTGCRSLNTHTQTHAVENPFKCDSCGLYFTQRTSLKGHMCIHTGEKPFKHDYCGVGFAGNNNVKGHLRTHTGEKPFRCDMCGICFAQVDPYWGDVLQM